MIAIARTSKYTEVKKTWKKIFKGEDYLYSDVQFQSFMSRYDYSQERVPYSNIIAWKVKLGCEGDVGALREKRDASSAESSSEKTWFSLARRQVDAPDERFLNGRESELRTGCDKKKRQDAPSSPSRSARNRFSTRERTTRNAFWWCDADHYPSYALDSGIARRRNCEKTRRFVNFFDTPARQARLQSRFADFTFEDTRWHAGARRRIIFYVKASLWIIILDYHVKRSEF